MTYKEDVAKTSASQENEKQIEATTRSERASQKKERASAEEDKDGKKLSRLRGLLSKYRTRVRLVPIWARLLIVSALLVLSLVAGLLVGYALVGEGDSLRVLSWNSWKELYHFIIGE